MTEANAKKKRTGGQLLADALVSNGVERVFCVPGESYLALLDALHEKIGNPMREIQVVRPAALIARVIAQLEKILDVRVPILQIDASRALPLATLIDSGHRRIERLQPRHDPVGPPIRALD